MVVEGLAIDEPKSKAMAAKLKELDLSNVLVITEEVDTNLYLAARNLPHVDVRDAQAIDPVSLIGFEKVLVTVSALKKIEEMLA